VADDWRTYARVALVVLGGVLALTLFVAASSSTASFSAYNSAWDGASALRDIASASGADVVVETEVEQAYARDTSIAFVLSPDSAYADEEIETIRRFVEAGGTLVVADDFGSHSNALLAGIGARTRIDGRLLRDERAYYRSPNLTRVTGVENASLLDDDRTLVLNHGTALRPNGATVLATSSGYSYLDGNRNYELDESEVMRSRPVVVRETLGEGVVVVVSDPSMFINAMVERDGNEAFVRALVSGHARVVLDYSHTSSVPPLAAAVLRLRETPVAQVVVGAVALGAVGIAVRRRETLAVVGSDAESDLGIDREAVAAYLSSAHPEWEADRIRRVMRGIMSDDPKGDENE
jgi:hypothetical protein